MNEELLPISGTRLANVSYDIAAIDKTILSIQDRLKDLVTQTEQLNEKDAHMVNSYIQVRNIKISAHNVKMYIGLADMLLCHMREDMNYIFSQRNAYKKAYEKRKMDMQNAERIAKHRAKDSSPGNE